MRGGRAAAAAVLLLAWALLGLPAPGAAETGAPPREQHRAATTAAPVPAVSAAAVEPAQTPETAQTPVPGETTVPGIPGETAVPGETAGEPVPCHGGPSRGHVGVRAPRAAGGAENGRGTGCAPAPGGEARAAVAGAHPAGGGGAGRGAGRVRGDVTRMET
ncbi:hypothetical protein ACWCQJ_36500, partial [Streptomyces olivaceus]